MFELNEDVFNEMESEYEKKKDEVWWMELETVYVPMIKKSGEESGGSIQLNISLDPENSRFRTIGFENETEAKYFAGLN